MHAAELSRLVGAPDPQDLPQQFPCGGGAAADDAAAAPAMGEGA